MLLGPAKAIAKLLQSTGLSIDEIDVFEIHEVSKMDLIWMVPFSSSQTLYRFLRLLYTGVCRSSFGQSESPR